ncbi:hypothetical protein AAVH_12470 [Aphelenchoides avenae]|nr:hypothetical protein AAVH_12470 [Aphelenchus avenae]
MVLVNFLKASWELQCVENGCDFTTKCIREADLHKSRVHGHELTLMCPFCSPRRQWFQRCSFLRHHIDTIHHGERSYLCNCGYVSATAFNDLRHRATCGQGNRRGNRKTKQHVNEQIELNITGESVFAKYSFSSRIVGEGTFGRVYTVTKADSSSAVKFAIKEVGLKGTDSDAQEHIAKARTEAVVMVRFRHTVTHPAAHLKYCDVS